MLTAPTLRRLLLPAVCWRCSHFLWLPLRLRPAYTVAEENRARRSSELEAPIASRALAGETSLSREEGDDVVRGKGGEDDICGGSGRIDC